ncbi:MAG: (E)-4-hydroxy-3-methylbut-2-enyl-diphosphate synthase [Chthoniobacterales bacterium]
MPPPLTYCDNRFAYHRALTREVNVGDLALGGENPIRIQSMLTSDTMDTATCVSQTKALVEIGCEIVRITAPTITDAANLEHIVAELRASGCTVPIVADIHFKPQAAMEAAKWVEKIRVNPGNYADSKKFAVREYSDEEYRAELQRLKERFSPLVEYCRDKKLAMRIGTNHGSLSDRIMNRYGDSPRGMVESALEFAHIARELDYHNFVFSMKASNPKIMIEAYRLLAAHLRELGPDWSYPLHLGVTEAGDGEDGRIKSAVGIGSLLADGLGDTIRVSLTEDSVQEIPVAKALVDYIQNRYDRPDATRLAAPISEAYPLDPFSYSRRPSREISFTSPLGETQIGGNKIIQVAIRQSSYDQLAHKIDALGDFRPDFVLPSKESPKLLEVDPRDDSEIRRINSLPAPSLVSIPDACDVPVIHGFRLLAAKLDPQHPILLKDTFTPSSDDARPFLESLLEASTNLGSLLCDGIGDAILVQGEKAPGQSLRLAFNILQAVGARIFKTDYVACPSCGRTLFDLQSTTARIKSATAHLKGVRIAIMGCIVNGPGEMADADFGYVGGAPGKVNLYVGKQAVKFNIPETEAVNRLIDLIKEHDRWVEAPPKHTQPDFL